MPGVDTDDSVRQYNDQSSETSQYARLLIEKWLPISWKEALC